jgi:hypothetical protein
MRRILLLRSVDGVGMRFNGVVFLELGLDGGVVLVIWQGNTFVFACYYRLRQEGCNIST